MTANDQQPPNANGDISPGTIADRPSTIPWPPMLLFATLFVAWLLGRVYPLAWPGLNDLPAQVIGYTVGLSGFGLMFWAISTLNRHKTTVLPHQGAVNLVTDGPYALSRNPIYVADALIMFGIAEITKNIWFDILIPVFAIAVTLLAIRPEERHLEARFGEAYRTYKDKTRRWI